MLISHTRKFIFLKTIKTAGTSVELALQGALMPQFNVKSLAFQEDETGVLGARGDGVEHQKYWHHMGAKVLRDRIGAAIFDDYTKASIVRNPFDKVVSWFFFKTRQSGIFDQDRAAFIEFVTGSRRLPVDRGIYTIGNKICCDRMIRFESLQAGIDRLFVELGLSDGGTVALPREKSTSRREKVPYQNYYDAATRAVVAQEFAFELDAFEYTFDGERVPATEDKSLAG